MLEELTSPAFILSISIILAPSYLANGMAAIFSGGPPLDRGKLFRDRHRILGDGKTQNGTMGAILFGLVGSLAVVLLVNVFLPEYHFGVSHLVLGFLSAIGAISGDILGAFIKRRMGLERGAMAPGLDQLGFILFAVLFVGVYDLLQPTIRFNLQMLAFALIVTPFMHLLGNFIGFKLGKKKVPW